MRTGLVAIKEGMTRVYDEEGIHIPVTALRYQPQVVIEKKTAEKHGYDALRYGYGEVNPDKLAKPQRAEYAKAKVPARKYQAEFRVSADNAAEVGAELSIEQLQEGQYVDICGISKGKGFSGAMKRHNFGGLRASHGVSISHRSHGSTGQCQDPGKVFKGKKMAGQYGNKQITVQNLRVVRVDAEKGIVLIKGAVPGAKGTVLRITDAVKKALPESAPSFAAMADKKAEKQAKPEEAGAAEAVAPDNNQSEE